MNSDEMFRKATPIRNQDLAGLAHSAVADALLAQISATDTTNTADVTAPAFRRTAWNVRRLLMAGVATALLAGGIVVGSSVLGMPDEVYAGEAVTIDRDGNDYVFYFTKGDPDPEALRKAFSTVGLDITVTLVPISPRDPFPYHEMVRTKDVKGSVAYQAAECAERIEGCLGSMRVSADLSGGAELRLGRPARPGERYEVPVDATLPGEVLAGVPIEGKTVAEAVRIVGDRRLKVGYTLDWPASGAGDSPKDVDFEERVAASRIDAGWRVTQAETLNDGVITLHVRPGPGVTRPPGS
ncbi:hypothetical protein [Nonomuraea guangzhouensis]|uniref:DUF348 domain-containing protein n=1 Tax=Nonomuraea guangzhouensis TaxID=1291555 RepID=A0ABW4GDP2_9ACTN|nr:hypothetical protein [Nonomuraea guangzhouensis]